MAAFPEAALSRDAHAWASRRLTVAMGVIRAGLEHKCHYVHNYASHYDRASTRPQTAGSAAGPHLGDYLLHGTPHEFTKGNVSGRDTFWSDKAMFWGQAPKDIARRHDDYLYGAE
jgi:hypothetical protein